MTISPYMIQDTWKIPSILPEQNIKEDKDDIPCIVESISTNPPLDDTIEYIFDLKDIDNKLILICETRQTMKRSKGPEKIDV